MGYVFISYSSKDRDIALRLAQDLKTAGLDPWMDRWKITGREPYWDEIQAGIEGCSYFLFLVSPDSLDKDGGARRELYHVASLKPARLIVPAMVRATPLESFPIVITPGEYEIHDFVTQPYETALPKLLVAFTKQGSTGTFKVPAAATPTAQTAPSSPTAPVAASRSRSPLWIGLATVALVAIVVSGLLLTSQLNKPGITPTQPATQPVLSTTMAPTGMSQTATPTPTPVVCPGFLPSRLAVGGQGRVTPGPANNLRSLADLTSNKIGSIPGGTVFEILRGPQCTKDGAWWLITYAGGTGWTIEGDASTYYLEPYSQLAGGASDATAQAAVGSPTSIMNIPAVLSDVTPSMSAALTATAQGGGSGKIAYTAKVGDRYQIFLVDLDGKHNINLTNTTSNEYSPSWSPDGQQIVFVSERDGNPQIYIMDADGANPRRVVISSSNDVSPDWSPNGRDIVFASNDGGNFNIYLVNKSGLALRQLTFNQADDYSPVWSPDGNRIAFVSNRSGGPEIYLMDKDSNHLSRLTTSPNKHVSNDRPVWSPDGKQIVFVSDRDGVNAIYSIGIAGNNLVRLTDSHMADSPAWSPDEALIVFVSDREQGLMLFMMGGSGQNVVHFLDTAANFPPAWQPTGP